ncbi:MAG: hypothetical protein A2066_12565 [Bacteroidetes bacterium GWB2_41_8]|nr:MAG: hypothetical protein A2066_12565 [Bacteroidetes bacterium GWB2_41_8]
MEQYSLIITEMETDLKRIAMTSDSMLNTAKSAIKRCRIALVELRWIVVNEGFPDIQSEIGFFKEIKTVAYSRLLFYQTVFEIESFRSKYDLDRIKRYMKVKLDEIQLYMEENASSVQYYNCGFTYLDSLYFVRERDEIPIELRGSQYLMDEQFNTWQDHTFSVIRANDMLVEYLNREIKQIDNQEHSHHLQKLSHLSWTGNKIDLVELVYALFFSRVINNGKITIKELAGVLCRAFNMDIEKDIYRYYTEIQQRKIEQTKFMEQLKSILQQQIDQNI